VTPSDAIVARTVPVSEATGSVTIVPTPREVNITDRIVEYVTNVIGLHTTTGKPDGQAAPGNATDVAGGTGSTTWGHGDPVRGAVRTRVVFHFGNQNGSSPAGFQRELSAHLAGLGRGRCRVGSQHSPRRVEGPGPGMA
jgi:hypothetical protein